MLVVFAEPLRKFLVQCNGMLVGDDDDDDDDKSIYSFVNASRNPFTTHKYKNHVRNVLTTIILFH